jgi:hypothetical protein
MAVFQYGAIITRISGSIGGTNFRLYRGMPVISNKSQGYSKSKLLSNNRISAIARIFRAWATINDEERGKWQQLSDNYTFPNKFGTQVTLSGQQFFVKVNSQSIPTGIFNLLSNDCEVTIDTPDFDGFVIDVFNKTADVSFKGGTIFNYYLFQAQRFTNTPRAPIFNRRKIFFNTWNDDDFTSDIFTELEAEVGEISVGDVVRLYYWNQSEGGLRSTINFVDVVAA